MELNAEFQDLTKLESYNRIVTFCGFDEQKSVTKCKEMMNGIYLNIFDYKHNKKECIYSKKWKLLKRCFKIGFFDKKRAKSENLNLLLKSLF